MKFYQLVAWLLIANRHDVRVRVVRGIAQVVKHVKMVEVNAKKKLVRKLPAATQVEGWVAQAKKLPRVIKY